jgi:D-alanyl-lipoteichoic acid acyltransferase DltB (MBOAT superfamily)
MGRVRKHTYDPSGLTFNSGAFVLFFPTVFVLYWSLRSVRAQNLLLLVASYVFYGAWDWRFCSLLLFSSVLDYACGLGIGHAESPRVRKLVLWTAITGNLGVLGFFKYFNFFVDSLVPLLEAVGLSVSRPVLHVVLPVGISFYTFQSMAYSIDVYRGTMRPTRDLLAFMVAVAFFPHLVAGPIQRAGSLLVQVERPRVWRWEAVESGLALMLWGFLKKVAIADAIAPLVDRAMTDAGHLGSLGLLCGLYLFAVQIYCDFSGYSDVARGCSRLLGIELMVNFRQPYLSANPTEFWRRWHISLSTWLRDYVYIPLGGSRNGPRAAYVNSMATMLIGGLWHGAAWTFVAWGALHGIFLAVHKWATGGRKIDFSRPPGTPAAWLGYAGRCAVTFHLVCLAWLFFRAPDFGTAWTYLQGLATAPLLGGGIRLVLAALVYCPLVLLADLAAWRRDSEVPFGWLAPAPARGAVYASLMLWLVFCRGGGGQPFIYFQF